MLQFNSYAGFCWFFVSFILIFKSFLADIQHNNGVHNDIQHNNTVNNDIQDNSTYHKDTQHNTIERWLLA